MNHEILLCVNKTISPPKRGSRTSIRPCMQRSYIQSIPGETHLANPLVGVCERNLLQKCHHFSKANIHYCSVSDSSRAPETSTRDGGKRGTVSFCINHLSKFSTNCSINSIHFRIIYRCCWSASKRKGFGFACPKTGNRNAESAR